MRKLPSTMLRIVFAIAFLAASIPAFSHAELGYNLRAMHFEYTPAGMMVYMRFSIALLVANKLGEKNPDGSFAPAPFTYNRVESGRAFHYLDVKAVKRDATPLGTFAIAGHQFSMGGKAVVGKLINVRVHPKGTVPPFARLDDAKNACKGTPYPTARNDEIDSGYVLVDVTVLYPQVNAGDEFQLKSTLTTGELGEPATKNLFWDHRGKDQETPFAAEGLIDAAILFSPPK
jgi:hypothetical protein